MQTARERFEADIKNPAPLGANDDMSTFACHRCRDAGWLRHDVLPSDRLFGQMAPCPCGLVARRSAEYARAKAGAR